MNPSNRRRGSRSRGSLYLLPLTAVVLLISTTLTHAGPVIFDGLTHTPLGSAILSLQNNDTELLVSNIGASGLDGVSVDLGNGNLAYRAEFLMIDASTIVPGNFMRSVSFGTANGIPNQQISEQLALIEPSGALGFKVDFTSLGAYTTETVQLFQNGNLLFTDTYNVVDDVWWEIEVEIMWPLDWEEAKPNEWFGSLTWKGLLKNVKGKIHSPPGGGPPQTLVEVDGVDEIRLIPNFDAPPLDVTEITTMQLFGSGIDSLTMTQSDAMVPEPSALVLFSLGGGMLASRRRRR